MNNKKNAIEYLHVQVPVFEEGATCDTVITALSSEHGWNPIDTIFVINNTHVLTGIVSLEAVFQHPAQTTLESIMITDVVAVDKDATMTQASHMALEHRLHDLPLIDEAGVFLGVLRSRDILAHTYAELNHRIFQRSGIHTTDPQYDDILTIPLRRSLKHRLPWLLFGLVGGLGATMIINQFEATLEKNVLLAAFIPLVVYMSDAVGTQVEAYVIRDLAIFQKPTLRYTLRQLSIVTMIGVIISALVALGTVALFRDMQIAMVIGLTLLISIISCISTGLFIPYVFHWFKQDPASGSGPVATIIQEVISIIIYFLIATAILS